MKDKFMCACIVFFPNGSPKRWKYVRDLKSFSQFLTKDHPSWKYFNVYDKGTKQFVKRFYPGNIIPKTLGLLLIALLTQKFTFSQTTFSQSKNQPLKNTTFNKTTFNTFTNGFNYYATIATPKDSKREGLC